MLGLGKARVEVPSQLASKFGFQRKFAACLSIFNGLILSGNEPSYDSISGTEISSGGYMVGMRWCRRVTRLGAWVSWMEANILFFDDAIYRLLVTPSTSHL
uniref:Uncharacterized protein n=1 Tax=Salix viminalis TaxID=40686 RepID=A0A6N2M5R2_SALVM